jgi:protein-L-isoaspartate(D-aspartate) O-methyltransferase
MLQTDRKFYAPQHPYTDAPQPIGHAATISAPHMHAAACEHLLPVLPETGAKILDVGCGSGYLTAGKAYSVCDAYLRLTANSTSEHSDGLTIGSAFLLHMR